MLPKTAACSTGHTTTDDYVWSGEFENPHVVCRECLGSAWIFPIVLGTLAVLVLVAQCILKA